MDVIWAVLSASTYAYGCNNYPHSLDLYPPTHHHAGNQTHYHTVHLARRPTHRGIFLTSNLPSSGHLNLSNKSSKNFSRSSSGVSNNLETKRSCAMCTRCHDTIQLIAKKVLSPPLIQIHMHSSRITISIIMSLQSPLVMVSSFQLVRLAGGICAQLAGMAGAIVVVLDWEVGGSF